MQFHYQCHFLAYNSDFSIHTVTSSDQGLHTVVIQGMQTNDSKVMQTAWFCKPNHNLCVESKNKHQLEHYSVHA